LIYAGKTEEMVVAYGAADVLIHPTFFDSCANVALEAASCKLPVIVSTTSGINEILPDEWSLSVQGDQEEVFSRWEHEMSRLAFNKELRGLRGEQGIQIAQKHGYENYLDWFEQRLDHVLMQAK
jgi:glycosyltransferase involved in cell wall biosynthesis